MDITWYGHSCFRISERGQSAVITDPYADHLGLPMLKLKGEVVTVSRRHPEHDNVEAVKGYNYVITAPGEYEVSGVFVDGLALHYADEHLTRENVAYLIRYGDLSVLHLGALAHVPDQSMIESLGQVNVVLVPVGGGDSSLRAAAAAEVIALIEPSYIVPMHYAQPNLNLELDPVEKFLKEMGVSKVQEEDILKVSASALPEQPQVVVLRPQI